MIFLSLLAILSHPWRHACWSGCFSGAKLEHQEGEWGGALHTDVQSLAGPHPWLAELRLSSAPAELTQPCPCSSASSAPKIKAAPFLYVAFHSPQAIGLSSKARHLPQHPTPPSQAALRTCTRHATCERTHWLNSSGNDVLLSFWGLPGSGESLEVSGGNRTAS